jgi:hypothetical protein
MAEPTTPITTETPTDATSEVAVETSVTPTAEAVADAPPVAEAAPEVAATETTSTPVVEVIAPPTERVFRTGGTTIPETEAMKGMSTAEVQRLLTPAYAELANADATEVRDGERLVVTFLPKAGRKG